MNTTVNTNSKKEVRKVQLVKLSRKVTNDYIKFAHTSTLAKLLVTFNYHFDFSKALDKEREELAALLKAERNRVLWENKIVA